MLERLRVRARLVNHGICSDSRCLFCGQHDEAQHHLLFECEFSKQLWAKIKRICGIQLRITNMQSLIGGLRR